LKTGVLPAKPQGIDFEPQNMINLTNIFRSKKSQTMIIRNVYISLSSVLSFRVIKERLINAFTKEIEMIH